MSGAEFGAGYTVKKTILYAAFSILISLIICFAAAVIFSAGAPVHLLPTVSWIICGAAGFIGGLVCARNIRTKCVLNGMLCGLFVFIVLFVFGLIFKNGVVFSKLMIKLVVCLFSGALGGMIGAGNKRRKSRAR